MSVCLREKVCTRTFSTGHKDFSARLAVSQMIITQIWFGSRVFWLQFPLLKQSDTHPVRCSASGPHSIYRLKGNLKGGCRRCVIGNLFNDSCNGDICSQRCTQFTLSIGKKNNKCASASVSLELVTQSNMSKQELNCRTQISGTTLEHFKSLMLLESVLYIN